MKTKFAIAAALLAVGVSADAHAQSMGTYKEANHTLPWPDQKVRIYSEPCWSAATSKCAWEARRAALRNGNGNGQKSSNHCDSLCQQKCQAAWRAGTFPNVEACYAKWSRLNANGTARQCEAAIKANGMRPVRGC